MATESDILKRLDGRREKLGMSMPNLARRAGLGLTTVQRALRGDGGSRWSTVLLLADVLEVDIRALPRASCRATRSRQASRKAAKMVGLAEANAALEADFSEPTRGVLRNIQRREKLLLLAGSDYCLWG